MGSTKIRKSVTHSPFQKGLVARSWNTEKHRATIRKFTDRWIGLHRRWQCEQNVHEAGRRRGHFLPSRGSTCGNVVTIFAAVDCAGVDLPGVCLIGCVMGRVGACVDAGLGPTLAATPGAAASGAPRAGRDTAVLGRRVAGAAEPTGARPLALTVTGLSAVVRAGFGNFAVVAAGGVRPGGNAVDIWRLPPLAGTPRRFAATVLLAVLARPVLFSAVLSLPLDRRPGRSCFPDAAVVADPLLAAAVGAVTAGASFPNKSSGSSWCRAGVHPSSAHSTWSGDHKDAG